MNKMGRMLHGAVLGLAGFLTLAGCSSGGKFGATAAAPEIDALPMFATKVYNGTVTLPAGSTLTPGQLTIVDSVTSATPTAAGAFQITAYDNGTVIAIALSPAGNPMLMGFFDSTHNTISAATTAQVFAFFALGGQQMLTESDRLEYIAEIQQLPGLAPLTQAIATEIATSPDAFAQTDIPVKTALNTLFTSITGVVPHAISRPQGILVNPTASQSGVTVLQDPPYSATMTNAYRRRTHAFILRQKDTLGTTDTPDAGTVTDFDIPPVVGLAGGVTGAVSDIFNAYFGNQPTAYAPQTTDPFAVALTSGFDSTTYQILNLGPGGNGQSLISTLTTDQHTALVKVSVAGFTTDALVPFFSNLVFGSGFFTDSRVPSATQAAFKTAFIGDLEADLLALLPSLPGEQDKLLAGDYRGVMVDLLQTLVTSNTVRGLFIEAEQQASTSVLGSALNKGAVTTAMQKFNVIMNAAGGVLQVFDSGVYNGQLLASDVVDTWSVVATGTKVNLTQSSTTANPGDTVNLTVLVPGVDLTQGVFSYLWNTTATAGSLTEVGGGGRTGQTASYCSSSSQANYIANASVPVAVVDAVSVQVFSGASCKAANSLGSAGAVISVSAAANYSMYGGAGAAYCYTPNVPAPTYIFINDDLYVYLNGNLVFTHIGAGCFNMSIPLAGAKKGDTVRLVIYDTYGAGTGLSALYMLNNSKYVLVDPGFLNVNTPVGNNGVQYDHSFTIPF